ncbi:hypothetical protein [Polyangium aurulentum]|uniref:hypothetical protein n=1 Tax=Polyangium aurulentum TaxID=2567896 RepID=UPI0010AE165D|nr:hypothetical protein [Polyangium aurulentum]UQA57677.1 hypothetical protein E8A73_041420 [Polyangium aurulentum]
MKKCLSIAMATAVLALGGDARADYDADLDKGVKIDLSKDGSRFLRILTWHQFWMRFNEHNPDSVVHGGTPDESLDIGIRRSRMLFHGQLLRDLSMVMHIGINNQSTVGGGFGAGDTPKKPQIFIHDAWGEYRVAGDWLSVGVGLHYWNGVSRLASASTINSMTMDSPIHNWPTIDKSDQFARQLGVYLKGKLWQRLEYRAALNHPFATTGEPREGIADYNTASNLPAVQGYFKFDFLEPESNQLPYYVGTYLGKKKVLNLGAGFYWHPDSMTYLEGGRKRDADTALFGIDTFLDLPVGWRGTAVTAYAGLVYHDFGPNYVRNIGLLNPSTGIEPGQPGSFNGPGNAVPVVGTGLAFYAHVGFLFPDMGRAGRLQPYAALRHSRFEGLEDAVVVPEGGLNWFIAGHHAKLTLHYRSRPVFMPEPTGKPTEQSRKSELTMQAQVFF